MIIAGDRRAAADAGDRHESSRVLASRRSPACDLATRSERVGGESLTVVGPISTISCGPNRAKRLRVSFERAKNKCSAAPSLEVAERPGFDEFGTRVEVGWVGAGHSRLAAVLGVPSSDSAAARAGLRSGDAVEAVGEQPVEDWRRVQRRLRRCWRAGRASGEAQRGRERRDTDPRDPRVG